MHIIYPLALTSVERVGTRLTIALLLRFLLNSWREFHELAGWIAHRLLLSGQSHQLVVYLLLDFLQGDEICSSRWTDFTLTLLFDFISCGAELADRQLGSLGRLIFFAKGFDLLWGGVTWYDMKASQVLRFGLQNLIQIALTFTLHVLVETQIFKLDQVALIYFFQRWIVEILMRLLHAARRTAFTWTSLRWTILFIGLKSYELALLWLLW